MGGWGGGGVEGYQYCQSPQLKLKNRRLKSNNKSNKTLIIIIIITAKEINTIYVAQLIEHLISVYMPVSIMRLRCHDLLIKALRVLMETMSCDFSSFRLSRVHFCR